MDNPAFASVNHSLQSLTLSPASNGTAVPSANGGVLSAQTLQRPEAPKKKKKKSIKVKKTKDGSLTLPNGTSVSGAQADELLKRKKKKKADKSTSPTMPAIVRV